MDPQTMQLDEQSALESGNAEVIGGHLDAYRQRLKRAVSFRMDPVLQGRVDASDVIQETLLEATHRIQDYFGSGANSLYIWLRYLAIQKLLQMRRFHVEAKMRDVRREVHLDPHFTAPSSAAQLADCLLASTSSPSETYQRHEQRVLLVEALEELDELDREILSLRCFEELSNAETAEVLGLKESSASTRFVRALAKLRRLMDCDA